MNGVYIVGSIIVTGGIWYLARKFFKDGEVQYIGPKINREIHWDPDNNSENIETRLKE